MNQGHLNDIRFNLDLMKSRSLLGNAGSIDRSDVVYIT